MMKRLSVLTLLALTGALMLSMKPAEPADGWVSLFDGKTFNGWKINEEHPSTFTIADGAISVHGDRAHLFYNGDVGNHNFKNFEFKTKVMTTPGSNSGIFIHTAYQKDGGPSQGYEIQVNQSHTDWRKTGSVYGVKDVKETFVKDNEWYTEHIIVQGKKITVKVNDKVINEYTEGETSKFNGGTIALQGHDPNSQVYYKDIMIKLLPD
jgi:hypothetical protein